MFSSDAGITGRPGPRRGLALRRSSWPWQLPGRRSARSSPGGPAGDHTLLASTLKRKSAASWTSLVAHVTSLRTGRAAFLSDAPRGLFALAAGTPTVAATLAVCCLRGPHQQRQPTLQACSCDSNSKASTSNARVHSGSFGSLLTAFRDEVLFSSRLLLGWAIDSKRRLFTAPQRDPKRGIRPTNHSKVMFKSLSSHLIQK